MSPTGAVERAEALLLALKLSPASRAASGRYRRSTNLGPGVRYWATSKPRAAQDVFGVQFYGEGCSRAAALAAELERHGFNRHRPQTGQDTFAKPIPFSPNGAIDLTALKRTRLELDAILDSEDRGQGGAAEAAKAGSLREFMLNSPLSEIDLPDPDRRAGWRETPL